MKRELLVWTEKGERSSPPIYVALRKNSEGLVLRVVDEHGEPLSCARLMLLKLDAEGQLYGERYPDVNNSVGVALEGTGHYMKTLRYRQKI